MKELLSMLLKSAASKLDAGSCELTEEDTFKIINIISEKVYNDYVSKYQAYTYLHISRAKFDSLVKEGKIPEGIKISGFKEKFWKLSDLKGLSL